VLEKGTLKYFELFTFTFENPHQPVPIPKPKDFIFLKKNPSPRLEKPSPSTVFEHEPWTVYPTTPCTNYEIEACRLLSDLENLRPPTSTPNPKTVKSFQRI
jgi:hypothetical protein